MKEARIGKDLGEEKREGRARKPQSFGFGMNHLSAESPCQQVSCASCCFFAPPRLPPQKLAPAAYVLLHPLRRGHRAKAGDGERGKCGVDCVCGTFTLAASEPFWVQCFFPAVECPRTLSKLAHLRAHHSLPTRGARRKGWQCTTKSHHRPQHVRHHRIHSCALPPPSVPPTGKTWLGGPPRACLS